jgi:hypothetical protein
MGEKRVVLVTGVTSGVERNVYPSLKAVPFSESA